VSGRVLRPGRGRWLQRGLGCAWLLGLALGAPGTGAQSPAPAATRLTAAIPPQPLATALAEYARLTGLQLVYVSDLVAARRTAGAPAGLSPGDTLTRLLEGTKLGFKYINARTVQILPAVPARARASSVTPAAGAVPEPSEHIVVTGRRSNDRLIPDVDVQSAAASVSVLDGGSLETQNFDRLADYARLLPGVSIDTTGVPGEIAVILRGISPLGDASSIVYYLDDTPIGGTGQFGVACCSPVDLMPFDLERLEVQRGPQGTHYGATSESGTIRYVLKGPSFDRFEARFGADVSAVHGASKPGASWRAMANAPILDDRLAIRVSAYDSYTPGYIDNVYSGARDVNTLRRYGGRIAALWLPSDSLSVRTAAFWNRNEADAYPEVSLQDIVAVPNMGDANVLKGTRSLGDLKVNRALPTPWSQAIDYYSGTLKWSAGSIEISSATAWSQTDTHGSRDDTPMDGVTVPTVLTRFERNTDIKKLTEELRLSRPAGDRVTLTAGAFYNRENISDAFGNSSFDDYYQPIPQPDFKPDLLRSTFDERALYGEVTWLASNRFDFTGGLRYDRIHQDFQGYEGDVLVGSGINSQAATTWMTAARYHLAPDVMLYARVATGSQPGSLSQPPIPPSRAEKLTSYETGIKSGLSERRALLDFTVFYIDWADIQTGIGDDTARAISRGAELSVTYAPVPALKLGLIAAYTLCAFTQVNLGVVPFLTGYQLGQVPKWSGAVSGDYDWALGPAWHAQVGGSFRWLAWQWGSFVQSHSQGGGPTTQVPPYSVLDLNAAIAKGPLAFKVYARNFFDTRAALHSNLSGENSSGVPVQQEDYILQPRTIGIGVDYRL
jgi:iron complex outermembrane receptor protein